MYSSTGSYTPEVRQHCLVEMAASSVIEMKSDSEKASASEKHLLSPQQSLQAALVCTPA